MTRRNALPTFINSQYHGKSFVTVWERLINILGLRWWGGKPRERDTLCYIHLMEESPATMEPAKLTFEFEEPDVSHLITEDDEPVDNPFSEIVCPLGYQQEPDRFLLISQRTCNFRRRIFPEFCVTSLVIWFVVGVGSLQRKMGSSSRRTQIQTLFSAYNLKWLFNKSDAWFWNSNLIIINWATGSCEVVQYGHF